MDLVRLPNPRLDGLEPYDPKSLPARVFLSANENSHNLPEALCREVCERVALIGFNRYPDPLANNLRSMIAAANGLTRGQVLVGNGGDELLFDLMIGWGGEGRAMLEIPPTFSAYRLYAEVVGTTVVDVERRDDYSIDEDAVLDRLGRGDVDFAIITSPNNPTGNVARTEFIERALDASDALILVDEAYGEFSGVSVLPLLSRHRNLVVLHTFSKAYSLASARIGYIFAAPEVIDVFLKVRQPYSVNSLTQAAAEVVYSHRDDFKSVIDDIVVERERLIGELPSIAGVQVFPSAANYVLVRVPQAHEVWERLYRERSVLVRDFSSTPGLEDCLRISVGTHDENTMLLDALREIVES